MENKLKKVRTITKLLDKKFNVFGFKFGLDPIIGLLPGGGDAISALISLYLVYLAYDMGVPKNKIGQMIFNIAIDLAVGAIPVAGDILDFVIKPNEKNLSILQKHIDNTKDSNS